MKKHNVQLAGCLALIFATFAFGEAIGMEKELPELEPQFMGNELADLSFLPPDVRRVIANKTLQLILDEAEDRPEMLMEKQWRAPKGVMEVFHSFQYSQEKAPVIDMIIFLIENGANPNTKNYKGNTVLHLLIKDFVKKTADFMKKRSGLLAHYRYDELKFLDQAYNQYLSNLILKIRLLHKHKINLNSEDQDGFTVAFPLISFPLKTKVQLPEIWKFIALLRDLGLDFYKDCVGITACVWGKKIMEMEGLDKERYGGYYQNQLDKICPLKK